MKFQFVTRRPEWKREDGLPLPREWKHLPEMQAQRSASQIWLQEPACKGSRRLQGGFHCCWFDLQEHNELWICKCCHGRQAVIQLPPNRSLAMKLLIRTRPRNMQVQVLSALTATSLVKLNYSRDFRLTVERVCKNAKASLLQDGHASVDLPTEAWILDGPGV